PVSLSRTESSIQENQRGPFGVRMATSVELRHSWAVLDGYQAAAKKNGRRDSRHRVEHIEVTTRRSTPSS
ncbi:hypothetical protein EN835_033720, partial [Mesorhizobium sp. M1C.F.Ca.ET.192.01.1.1]